VLTLDELQAFVKEHAPARPRTGEQAGADLNYDRDYFGVPSDPRRTLRLLLARRQMREQRFDEALATFRSSDFRLDDEHESLAAVANEYVSAVRRSDTVSSGVERASELFKAAQLSKQFGMELMGYELGPDFALYNGIASLGGRSPAEEGPFTSKDEVTRVNANLPPEARFHYRGVAQELAKRAADNLPSRSHAFAAVLCTSLRWARSSGDAELAQSIYQRYVREGAYVAWSEKFGSKCEEPDFPRASKLLWKMRVRAARIALRPYKIPFIALVAAAAIGGAVFATRRYRRRAQNN
jgi:hypothetical protein